MKTKEDCAYCGTPLTTTGVYRNGKYFCWEGHAEAYEIDDGKFGLTSFPVHQFQDPVITLADYPDQIRMEAIKVSMAAGFKDTGDIIANAKIIEKYLRTGD